MNQPTKVIESAVRILTEWHRGPMSTAEMEMALSDLHIYGIDYSPTAVTFWYENVKYRINYEELEKE